MPYQPILTDEQRGNLATLAAYLRTLPREYPDFAMSLFVNNGENGYGGANAHVPECGTAACAAGHGPLAGILPLAGEGWREYSERAFITVGSGEGFDADQCDAWDWCFASSWSGTDNTAHGAAARITEMLDKGVPDDSWEQMLGRSPLYYGEQAA